MIHYTSNGFVKIAEHCVVAANPEKRKRGAAEVVFGMLMLPPKE